MQPGAEDSKGSQAARDAGLLAKIPKMSGKNGKFPRRNHDDAGQHRNSECRNLLKSSVLWGNRDWALDTQAHRLTGQQIKGLKGNKYECAIRLDCNYRLFADAWGNLLYGGWL
jgi:hypothetical protein